jgi:hypothetical protein
MLLQQQVLVNFKYVVAVACRHLLATLLASPGEHLLVEQGAVASCVCLSTKVKPLVNFVCSCHESLQVVTHWHISFVNSLQYTCVSSASETHANKHMELLTVCLEQAKY